MICVEPMYWVGRTCVVCAIGVDGDQAPNCGDAQIGDGFFSIEVLLIYLNLIEWQLVGHESLQKKVMGYALRGQLNVGVNIGQVVQIRTFILLC